jgi:hypothetical protein
MRRDMPLHELVFGIPLTAGMLLVLSSTLGRIDAEGGDADAGQQGDGQATADLLTTLLGIGRVPLVIVCMLLCLLFGGVGLIVSPPAVAALGEGLGCALAAPSAALVSVVGTGWLVGLIADYLPSTESYAPGHLDLLGLEATVLLRLSDNEVVARVLDRGGAEQRVHCVFRETPAAPGERVLLTAYDRTTNRYSAERIGR